MIATLNDFLYYLLITNFDPLRAKSLISKLNLLIIRIKKYSYNKLQKECKQTVRETQTIYGLEYIPYNQFYNIKFHAKGGSSRIYKATWQKNEIQVVLKDIEGPRNSKRFFLNELMVYDHCGQRFSDSCFQEIYGITQHSETKKDFVVMKFAKHGDLHNYLLENNNTLTWKKRLNILCRIVWNLSELHKKNIIHCDLHSGNILINSDNLGINVKISDFGVSKRANVSSEHNEVYGIISYIAPEVLKYGRYTKKSDIYSLGILIWEVMCGYKPFYDREHDVILILDIMDGLRPNFIDGTPKEIFELMKRCWDDDHLKRPSALDVMNELNTIIRKLDENQISFPKNFSYIKMTNPRVTHSSHLSSSFINRFLKASDTCLLQKNALNQ